MEYRKERKDKTILATKMHDNTKKKKQEKTRYDKKTQ